MAVFNSQHPKNKVLSAMGAPIKKPKLLGASRYRALEILTVSLLVPSYLGAPTYVSKTGLNVATRTIAWLVKHGLVEYVNAHGAARITPSGRQSLVKVLRADAAEKDAVRQRALDYAREQVLFQKREEARVRKLNASWLRRMNKIHGKKKVQDADLD